MSPDADGVVRRRGGTVRPVRRRSPTSVLGSGVTTWVGGFETPPGVFRLYEDVFGQSLTEGSRRRWRWQYLDNPLTGPEGPEIWVARQGADVLGQNTD